MSDLKNRFYLLDSIRGVCILGMILYHTLFDAAMFFLSDLSILEHPLINGVRDLGATVFVLLAGINLNFEHSFIKRALLLNCAGIMITVVTGFVMPDAPVLFGILTFMGMAGLLCGFLKPLLEKIDPIAGMIVSFILFALFFNVYYGGLGIFSHLLIELPSGLYRNYLTAFFGFPFNGFASSDYFPLLPWLFAYLTGFFFWRKFGDSIARTRFAYLKIPFVEKAGKYSFYVYLAHQPIVYGLVYLVFLVTMHKSI